MDDQPGGSAPDESPEQAQPGLLGRLFPALKPRPDPVPDSELRPAAPTSRLGMANLRRQRVEDVMIPKADISAVVDSISRDELVDTFRNSGFTRLPVYTGTLDTPIGFVNLKDFALLYAFDCERDEFDLSAMLRRLLFVPPSMPLGVLLQKMQAERTHMALVIDEYGGTDGLVTIEDLLEQIVGEIEDEHDVEEDALFVRDKDGTYMVLAKCPLEDFEAELGHPLTEHQEIDEEEIETLGGLVFMLAGRVPTRGEVIRHPAGPEFEVVDADPRRIKRLRVVVNAPREG